MARSFAGAGVALVTPFTRSGDLDETALRRTVRRQIEGSIDVLVPCGTTGEAVTMTPKEQLRVIEITVEEAGGTVPVLAGTGTNDTQASIEKSKAAAAAGAAGVLCVGPDYTKPTPEGFYRHYTANADSRPVPVVARTRPGARERHTPRRSCASPLSQMAGEGGLKLASHGDPAPGRASRCSGDDAFAFAPMALGRRVSSPSAQPGPREMHDLAAACARATSRGRPLPAPPS